MNRLLQSLKEWWHREPGAGSIAMTVESGLALIKHKVNTTHCSQIPSSLHFDFFTYL
ncbi:MULTISPECIES: hypothetical protein [unclassified Imperialibacter]|uniref:hypothetical protein n=1 Tax=unclassified Imperialibacter TaxID=2629706 RepID=UPI001869705E|nr:MULTISPECIES: hypothetical protein [unclassified Imperialibacter]